MYDSSTISWMIMGGPRYDEHSQYQLDQQRALREQHLEAMQARSSGWLTRLVGFLEGWTAPPAKAPTAEFCTVDRCVAA